MRGLGDERDANIDAPAKSNQLAAQNGGKPANHSFNSTSFAASAEKKKVFYVCSDKRKNNWVPHSILVTHSAEIKGTKEERIENSAGTYVYKQNSSNKRIH